MAQTLASRIMLKVLQGNLHRSPLARDIIYQLAREKSADLLIISEPPIRVQLGSLNWFPDEYCSHLGSEPKEGFGTGESLWQRLCLDQDKWCYLHKRVINAK